MFAEAVVVSMATIVMVATVISVAAVVPMAVVPMAVVRRQEAAVPTTVVTVARPYDAVGGTDRGCDWGNGVRVRSGCGAVDGPIAAMTWGVRAGRSIPPPAPPPHSPLTNDKLAQGQNNEQPHALYE